MKRKHGRDNLKTLNIHGRVILPFVNVIEDRAVANEYPYPEFLQETMFAEHGTEVLITDPAADKYLADVKDKMKDNPKFKQWIQEPEGDPSY